jgi:PAS domain S-box-containing protein/diguanylate cyclase (GGDEF)-like protein
MSISNLNMYVNVKEISSSHIGDNIDENKALSQQVSILFDNAWFALIGSICAGAILIGVTWDVSSHQVQLLWGTLFLSAALYRFNLLQSLKKSLVSQEDYIWWRNRFFYSLFFSGLIWSIAGMIIPPQGDIFYHSLVAFCLCGLVAGAMASFSVHLPSVYAFSISAILPYSIFLINSTHTSEMLLGINLLIFLIIILIIARKVNIHLMDNINLQEEKTSLLKNLEKQVVERTLFLEKEISKREDVQKQLALNEEKYRRIVENTSDLIQSVGMKGEINFVNETWKKKLGYNDEDIKTLNLFDVICPEEKEHCFAMFEKLIQEQEMFNIETAFLAKDGSYIYLEGDSKCLYEDGKPVSTYGFFRDITEKRKMQNALKRSEEQFRSFFEHSPYAIILCDSDGYIKTENTEAKKTFNILAVADVAIDIIDLVHPVDRHKIKDVLKRFDANEKMDVSFELRLLGNTGFNIWGRTNVFFCHEENIQYSYIAFIIEDVTNTKKLIDSLDNISQFDPATNLLNRKGLFNHFHEKDNLGLCVTDYSALVYIDIDLFKLIHDNEGFQAGEEALQACVREIQAISGRDNIIVRAGDDEVVVLTKENDIVQSRLFAQLILEKIRTIQIKGSNNIYNLSASIGFVSCDDPECSIEDYLLKGNVAARFAREQGRDRIHEYNKEDLNLIKANKEIVYAGQIQSIVENEKFEIFFQTIKPVWENKNYGHHYEILLRIDVGNGMLEGPADFLMAAEKYSLSNKIDRVVIEKTISTFNNNPDYIDKLEMCSINLSANSIADEEFNHFIVDTLEKSIVSPEQICFEITETAAITDFLKARHFIDSLRKLGCRFALDDFGTGVSSLAYLQELPIDYLKIDGIFVKDIHMNKTNFNLTRNISELGHTMGMKVIAEYVENDEILARLQHIGVDYAQGYGIAKPAPLQDLF